MASAVLTGVTKLNVSGMQKGFKELKKTVQQFRKEVVQPFSEAAGALMSFTKKALIAGAAVAGIGIKEAFGDEQAIVQFQALGMSIQDAKKRYDELSKLARSRGGSLFPTGTWAEASQTLRNMGGAALDNNQMLTLLGDASAKSRRPLLDVTKTVGEFYAKLSGGQKITETAIKMFRDGIISEAAMKKIVQAEKAGQSQAVIWRMVTTELGRSGGAMALMASTGSAQFTRLRTVIGQTFGTVFEKMADRVKDVLYRINEALDRLLSNGTFARWGQTIGEWTEKIVNSAWRIILAWRNLDENTRTQLTSLLGGFVAFLVAWKTGFLSAMVNGMIGLGTFIAGHFALILGIVAAFATAFLGYNLGKTIYESLSPGGQGMLQKFMASLMGFVDLMKACFVTLWEMAKVTGENIWAAITGKGTNFSGDFDNVIDKFKKEYNRILDQYGQISRDIDKDTEKQDKNNDGSSFADRFLENFQKNFDPKKWWDDFKKFGEGMIPDSLKEFFKQLQTMQGIKFPKMPEVKPLDQQLNTKGVLRDLYMMSRYTLRGIYSMLPRPPRKIVKEDTPRDTKTQTPGKPGAPEKPNTPPAVTSDNENQVTLAKVDATLSDIWSKLDTPIGILAEIRDSVRRIQDAAGALPHLPSPGEAVAAAKRGSVDNVPAGRKPGDVQQQDHTGEVVARLDTSNQLLSQIGTGVNRLGGKLTPCWG